MRDLIGRTLGHYRIVEKIGEGGMGEVYRAHDERLDRDVAVKVLPEEVAGSQDRLERFEREAKLLASLNHPKIATLHGLEEEGNRRFLVMELVEGESLASVVARGAIPFDEALPIALQIAQALEAAHEDGVIHRDLKPANVMVDSNGGAKVLDFGLAKAFDPEGSGPQSPESIAESPTLTADLTRGGVLLGTAAYMSPEQARGKPVDKRADIWAFGCTLYEMLAGARPFPGATSTEVLAAIIKEEPDWDVLPADTPPLVRRLLRRCLTKDPRDRLHDIADARLELQLLTTGENDRDETLVLASPRASWRRWLPWGLVAVFACLAVTVLVGSLRTPPTPAVTKTLVGLEPAKWLGSHGRQGWRTEWAFLSRTAMALSPDGRHLVFEARDDDDTGRRLYLRALDENRASPIDGTEGGVGPFFSPDGEWIGFWADGVLKKVPIGGGSPIVVCDVPASPIGASWGPDNEIFLGSGNGGLLQVSEIGGAPREITELEEGENAHAHPQILPDGKTLLFSILPSTGWNARIAALDRTTGEKKVLVENGADPRYAPTGHLVFARVGTLMAVPFDRERVEVTGDPGVVLGSVRQAVNAANEDFDTFSAQFTFSASGGLVYVPGGVWPDSLKSLVWVDRTGQTTPLSAPPANYVSLRLSPDGSRLAFKNISFPNTDIWVHDFARGTSTRLTFGYRDVHFLVWSPDGSHITFSTRDKETGRPIVATVSADGSGAPEIVEEFSSDDVLKFPASWSPDGDTLAFVRWVKRGRDQGDFDVWMYQRGEEPRAFIESPFDEWYPVFSPDGRWLAYASDQSGRFEVYVTPYPGPGAKVQVSTEGGFSPTWSPDGRELFFLGAYDYVIRNYPMCAVDVSTEPTLVFGTAQKLFSFHQAMTIPLRSHDVSRDGQKFVMCKKEPWPGEPVTHINVTLNWFEELQRLVPTE